MPASPAWKTAGLAGFPLVSAVNKRALLVEFLNIPLVAMWRNFTGAAIFHHIGNSSFFLDFGNALKTLEVRKKLQTLAPCLHK